MLNDGHRPSLLAADLHLSGELVSDDVATWLSETPEGQAHAEAVRTAKERLGPPDIAALRERAATGAPKPANNHRYFAVALALAAALLLALAPTLLSSPTTIDPTYVGVRGQALTIHHLQDGSLRPYDDRELAEGDVLGFQVDPGLHSGVVLLSVDGDGVVSVYYPEHGDTPEKLSGPGPLPGSVVLDGAPGPEVFVALFDLDVPAARDGATEAWQAGGVEGLVDWADTQEADVQVVRRMPRK